MTSYRILKLSLIFIIFVTLCGKPACAEIRLEGMVTDYQGDAIARALVKLPDINLKTYTGDDGRFTLNIGIEPPLRIIVEAPGYESEILKLTAPFPDRPLIIELSPVVYRFDEVVVSASRSPEPAEDQSRPVSLIGRRKIDSAQPQTTAQILSRDTPVSVQKTSHSGGAPIIRGLFGKHVLVLTDGIRLNNSTYRTGTNPYINTIPMGAVYRMEIIEGPSSVMYGSDALGGIINIITEPPADMGYLSSYGVRYSSADEGWMLDYAAVVESGNGLYSLGLEKRDIGDLRGGADIGRQAPSGWEDIGGNFFARYMLSRRFMLKTGLQLYDAANIPRYDKYVEGQYDFYHYDPRYRRMGFIQLTDTKGFRGIDETSVTYSYQNQAEGRAYRKTGSDKTTRQELGVFTHHFNLNARSRPTERISSTFGIEFYFDKVDSWRADRYPDSSVYQVPPIPDGASYMASGLYLQSIFDCSPELKIRSGLRLSLITARSRLESPYNDLDETYSDLSVSAGILYRLAESVSLIFDINKGFRAPNLDDLAKLEISAAGREVPSLGLVPENSYQFDLGLRWNRAGFKGDFFIWGDILTDFIDRRRGTYNGLDFWDENGNGIRDAGEDLILVKKNVQKYYMRGAEASIDFKITSRWDFGFRSFYTYGENAVTAEPMSKIPPLTVRLALGYHPRLLLDRFELSSEMAGAQNRLSELDIEDPRMDPDGTPAWAVLNLSADFRPFHGLYPVFKLNNIFDTPYKTHASGIYSPGRNAILSLKFRM